MADGNICIYVYLFVWKYENYKEVFVKHEKAPTAPRFEGGIEYFEYAHVLKTHNF